MWGISATELVHFSKNLSLMLRSGMTINESLEELADEASSKRLAKILRTAKHDVESGVTLSDALSKHRRAFGDVMLAVVKAGETSGTLDENLSFLAEWLEHDADIRREVHGAMIYPAIVFVATISMSSGLALMVLPRLLPIFAQMSVELPMPTRILLWATNTMKESWYFVFAGIAALVAVFIVLNRMPSVRRFFHGMYLATPFVGRMLMRYQLTLVGQLFTTLFRSGMSIFEILEVTANGATNVRYREALHSVGKQLERGTTLADALKQYPKLFPREFTSILAVGEKSGTLEESFRYLTEYNRKEVYTATKRLPTIIEPVLLLLMGVLVAFIAIAIILPIYQFTSNVRG